MSKNKNVGGFISDDGFPLGIAYLLKILNQSEKFAGLNWFNSMIHKLDKDHESAQRREKEFRDMPDMNMGMTEDYQKLDAEMSRRRINRMKEEYEMLNFCFSASSILFKEI